MQGLGHIAVVGSGHLPHVVLVEGLGNVFDLLHRGLGQLVFALGHLEELMRRLAVLTLEQRPDLLYRIELAALRWEELRDEVSLVEELVQQLGMVDSQVVHDDYGLALRALPLELSNKGNEGVHRVGPCEDMGQDEAVLEAESSYD